MTLCKAYYPVSCLFVIVIICYIFPLPVTQTAHLLVHIYITKLSASLLRSVDSLTGDFIINFPNKNFSHEKFYLTLKRYLKCSGCFKHFVNIN